MVRGGQISGSNSVHSSITEIKYNHDIDDDENKDVNPELRESKDGPSVFSRESKNVFSMDRKLGTIFHSDDHQPQDTIVEDGPMSSLSSMPPDFTNLPE